MQKSNNFFIQNPNIEQYAPKVFLYKNFISGNLLKKINTILEKHKTPQKLNHNLDWYESRFTGLIPEMHEVWEKISDFLFPVFLIHPQLSLLRSLVNEPGMFAHSDSPGQPHDNCGPVCETCEIASKAIISPDVWNTCCRLHYGLVVYFGEFEGGEIYYPKINKHGEAIDTNMQNEMDNELVIKPCNGDMIIHGSHSDCSHGTRPITNGIRFAYSNFVIPSHVNPGTFYDYNSKDYFKQINWIKNDPENRWSTWCNPVNDYVWKEPLALIEDKEKGLKTIRYRDIDSNGNIF